MVLGWTWHSNVKIVESSEANGRLNPEHESVLSRNTYVDYGMRFVAISEKDEVLRISHAVMSELFDRRLALPQYARKRIRWCEIVVSLKESRAVAVQRFLARNIHFDAHGFLDLD